MLLARAQASTTTTTTNSSGTDLREWAGQPQTRCSSTSAGEFDAYWAGRMKWDLRAHGYREVEEDLPEWETRAPRTIWVRRLDRAEDEPWLESDPEEDAFCELIGYWGQPPQYPELSHSRPSPVSSGARDAVGPGLQGLRASVESAAERAVSRPF